jgi:hypothetical protein
LRNASAIEATSSRKSVGPAISTRGGVDARQRPLERPEACHVRRLTAQVFKSGGVSEVRGDALRCLQRVGSRLAPEGRNAPSFLGGEHQSAPAPSTPPQRPGDLARLHEEVYLAVSITSRPSSVSRDVTAAVTRRDNGARRPQSSRAVGARRAWPRRIVVKSTRRGLLACLNRAVAASWRR